MVNRNNKILRDHTPHTFLLLGLTDVKPPNKVKESILYGALNQMIRLIEKTHQLAGF